MYEISDWKAKNLTKEFSDLIEDEEKPKEKEAVKDPNAVTPVETAAPQTQDPNTAAPAQTAAPQTKDPNTAAPKTENPNTAQTESP